MMAVALALVAVASPALALPDPLTLGLALQELRRQPRDEGALAAADMPRRPSLYLDCRQLAFSNSQFSDDRASVLDRMLLEPRAAWRLETIERFFDVLLADLSFTTESEAMAVAYVQYDRALARQGLGQLSELRVLELEAVYQDLLHRRVASQASQQLTRSLLAQAIGVPGELPRDLVPPTLPEIPEQLPALEVWTEQAERHQSETALGEDPRASSGAGSGGATLLRRERRQQINELLLRLRVLGAAQQSVQVESAWRDLKLDQSRTLYELEVTADLGYSMSQQTRTRMREKRVAYCRALAWAELHELVGRPFWTTDTEGP
ncbi:hypothetical protein [Thiorhodococcus minor]|uniref:TolC family protein n=1 Tax=Thiorhodococcus minor TaxID=57489 RepID=A0A6M0K0W7_9GAMM|nr:hypothetical protein [Thiorhodococcus minor]NEV62247.1 hypothetical protein [Thiorhodococcus minor]